jgi:hypothetical protein
MEQCGCKSNYPKNVSQILYFPSFIRTTEQLQYWQYVTDGHVLYTKRPCLGAFAKLRKATISFVMSVCLSVCQSFRPSVRMEQLGSQWTDFRKIWFEYFSKPVEKIQILLKYVKNNRYFTWKPIYILISYVPCLMLSNAVFKLNLSTILCMLNQ